ncbi:serine/threonine-protein kinase, partial [Burkholderia cenocepacia]|uniref:serine/threonine-protein kinase n=1 Tax=Burkholderia cenocepacia TaxID=95486 RepID=UPI0038CC0CE7
IVHRDVKPSNILLSPSPVPTREFDARLTDFGIATMEGGARLTATGTVLGTAAYLSPEQALGDRVTPAADVYSLGLVLLEMITGTREFPGPALEALSARVLRDPVVPAEVHPRWAALLTAMSAREPRDRPTTEQVVHELALLAHDRVPTMQAADGVDAATLAMPRASIVRASRTAPMPASAARVGARRPRRRLLLAVAGIAATVTALIGAVA